MSTDIPESTGTVPQTETGNQKLQTLYGVGVGPGDPGLVTLKAVEVIKSVPTVAYPVAREGAVSRAFEVVREHVSGQQRQLPLLMPMTRDRERLRQAHDTAVAALEEAAATGEVAYLSLGDPLFYSTFGYLAARFAGPVEVISGVSAMSAMSSVLGLPLADGDTPTVVLSGNSFAALESALEMGSSVVIIKPKALSEESLALLEESGALGRALAVTELGNPGQRLIRQLDRETVATLPYFAVVWVPISREGQEGAI